MDMKRNLHSYVGYSPGKNWTHDLPFGSDFMTTCRLIYWIEVNNSEGGLAAGQTRYVSTARTLKEAKTFLAYWLWFKLGVVNSLCLSALSYVWWVDLLGVFNSLWSLHMPKRRTWRSVVSPITHQWLYFSPCVSWSALLSTVSWRVEVRFVLGRSSVRVNPSCGGTSHYTSVESDRNLAALRREPISGAILRFVRRRYWRVSC